MKSKILMLSLISAAAFAGQSNDDFYREAGEGVLLNDSVVSTTGFETSQRNIANTVSVVTAEEILEKNYQSVSEILEDIPSVNLIGSSKNPIVDMRGQGKRANANVQILIDGVASNLLDSSHANTPINIVPVENIAKIEVIPGGGAILYGSGTRGGIINIITKDGSGERGGFLRSEVTSYGGRELDGSYGDSIGNLSLSTNFNINDYKGYRDGDELDSRSLDITGKYKIDDKQRVMAKYSYYDGKGTSPRALTREMLSDRESNGLIGKYDKLQKNDTRRGEFNLKYNFEINENTDFEMTAFYQKTDIKDINDYDYKSNGIPMGMEVTNNMKFSDEKYGVKPKVKIGYGDKNQLIVGYDYIENNLKRDSRQKIFSPEFYKNDMKKRTDSIFLLNRNPIGNFEFTQGLRYEHADYDISRGYKKLNGNGEVTSSTDIDERREMDNWAYEMVGNYLYSDTGNIYAKWEKGFTSPTPSQLVDKLDGIYVQNNLKSEIYTTYELGFKDYLVGSFVKGAVFYTESKDEITTENYAGMNFRNFNIGKTRRYGFEFSAQQEYGKFTLSEGYSFIKTKILEDSNSEIVGKEIADIPQNRFNLGIKYQATPKLDISWNTVYQSAVYLNNENSGGKANSYVVTDLVANYQVTENLRVFGGVDNLFNRKYYETINSKGTEFSPAGERMFKGGFRYNF